MMQMITVNGEMLMVLPTGLSQAAPDESSSDKDAHIRYPVCVTGNPGFVDREGSQQERILLYITSTKDGGVRSIHQCTARPHLDQHPTKVVPRPHKFEGEGPPDSHQQFDCTSSLASC